MKYDAELSRCCVVTMFCHHAVFEVVVAKKGMPLSRCCVVTMQSWCGDEAGVCDDALGLVVADKVWLAVVDGRDARWWRKFQNKPSCCYWLRFLSRGVDGWLCHEGLPCANDRGRLPCLLMTVMLYYATWDEVKWMTAVRMSIPMWSEVKYLQMNVMLIIYIEMNDWRVVVGIDVW